MNNKVSSLELTNNQNHHHLRTIYLNHNPLPRIAFNSSFSFKILLCNNSHSER